MQFVYGFLGAGAAFLVLDLVWLGLVADKFYHRQLGDLMASSFNVPAAIAFYLVYLVGVMIFAIAPAIEQASLTRAIVVGAMFGFFCYATFDLTNLAVLRDYPLKMALVDIAWGTFLTGSAAACGYLASRFAA